jgi:hypothetical protein
MSFEDTNLGKNFSKIFNTEGVNSWVKSRKQLIVDFEVWKHEQKYLKEALKNNKKPTHIKSLVPKEP